LKSPKIIQYALKYIADSDESGRFTLNRAKTIKALALAMLYVKGDYYLSEFVLALKHAIDLALPLENKSIDQVMNDETDKA